MPMILTDEQQRRIDFHNVLLEIVPHAYFDPPENLKLSYPCAIYSFAGYENRHGDNLPYIQTKSYKIIVMTLDPEDPIVGKIAKLPKCSWQTGYWVGSVRHDVFKIYY